MKELKTNLLLITFIEISIASTYKHIHTPVLNRHVSNYEVIILILKKIYPLNSCHFRYFENDCLQSKAQ